MKIRGGLFQTHHANSRRDVRIHGRQPCVDGQAVIGNIDMRGLPAGMDSGIGAPGTMDNDALAAKQPEGRLQGILHGFSVRLALPS